MPSQCLSRCIRTSVVAAIVAACSSSATDAPVTPPPTAGVKLTTLIGPADSLCLEETYQMTALNGAGRPIALGLAWSSSAPTVVSVSTGGLITANGLGNATIGATFDSLHADLTVNVGNYTNAQLQIAESLPVPNTLDVGFEYQLVDALYNSRGALCAKPKMTWTSSNPAVVSVSASGVLTPHLGGQATITATDDKISGTLAVTVRNPQLAFTILPDAEFGDTLQAAPGETLNLVPVAYNDIPGRPTTPTGQVTWSSSDSGVATVSQMGLVTGVAPGMATVTANILQHPATRTIRVAAASGTATIRMISAADALPTVTMHPNSGVPATLAPGAASEQVIPAGTLQLSLDGILPLTTGSAFDPTGYDLQVFFGFLPAGAHETFIAVSNPQASEAIAWFNDRTKPVPADSSVVRLLLATFAPGFNVFFTDPGAPATVVALAGCYLDGPFAYTDYSSRSPGDFDIVLLGGKLQPNPNLGPEVARFHVTATAGHALTFVLTGNSMSALKVVSLVDR
jgi:uncharacterized protein YjdB